MAPPYRVPTEQARRSRLMVRAGARAKCGLGRMVSRCPETDGVAGVVGVAAAVEAAAGLMVRANNRASSRASSRAKARGHSKINLGNRCPWARRPRLTNSCQAILRAAFLAASPVRTRSRRRGHLHNPHRGLRVRLAR